MPPVRIEIRGPAFAFTARKQPVIDAATLQDLDGSACCEKPLIEDLDDSLFDAGVRGGALKLALRGGKLLWTASYTSPRKLSASKLKLLVRETDGQISDGAGEGGFDFRCLRRRVHVDLGWDRAKGGTAYRVEQSAEAGDTPRHTPSLFPAIRAADRPRVIKLLDRGAELDEIGKFNLTPLITAMHGRQWAIADLLVRRGARVDHRTSTGTSVLAHALMTGAPVALLRLLLNRGASVEEPNNELISPLMWAANRGNTRAVELLLAAGADPNHQDELGRSALMFAQTSGRQKIEVMLRLLIEGGANPDLRNADGENAVEDAVESARGFSGDTGRVKMELSKAAFLKRAMQRR